MKVSNVGSFGILDGAGGSSLNGVGLKVTVSSFGGVAGTGFSFSGVTSLRGGGGVTVGALTLVLNANQT
ncbi:hypothetical protein [Streptococcus suis]|uniref:hypothetical protein n=1 Tax=Streptococcus suis TaxID=1307 RepID=UPI0013053219|nr:hypothetical protein [Streptococcus suis]